MLFSIVSIVTTRTGPTWSSGKPRVRTWRKNIKLKFWLWDTVLTFCDLCIKINMSIWLKYKFCISFYAPTQICAPPGSHLSECRIIRPTQISFYIPLWSHSTPHSHLILHSTRISFYAPLGLILRPTQISFYAPLRSHSTPRLDLTCWSAGSPTPSYSVGYILRPARISALTRISNSCTWASVMAAVSSSMKDVFSPRFLGRLMIKTLPYRATFM